MAKTLTIKHTTSTHEDLDRLETRAAAMSRHEWLTCQHEAGHCVACICVGANFEYVELHYNAAGQCTGGQVFGAHKFADDDDRLYFLAFGLAVELELCSAITTPGAAVAAAGLDLREAKKILGVDDPMADPRFQHQLTLAREMASACEDSIRVIALQLFDRPHAKLTERQVQKLNEHGYNMP